MLSVLSLSAIFNFMIASVPILGTVNVSGRVLKNTVVGAEVKSQSVCDFTSTINLYDLQATKEFPYDKNNFSNCVHMENNTSQQVNLFFSTFVMLDVTDGKPVKQYMASLTVQDSTQQIPVRTGAATHNLKLDELILQVQPTIVNKCDLSGNCQPNLGSYYSAVVRFQD